MKEEVQRAGEEGDGVRKEKVLVSSGLSEITVVCEALLRFPCVNH